MMGGGREVEEQQAMAAPAGHEKSSFAVTCSLLSQYLKEKKGGQLLHGALGMAPPPPAPGAVGVLRPPPTTMNLLSALDTPAEPKDAATAEPRRRTSDSVELSPADNSTTELHLQVAPNGKQNGENARDEEAGEATQQLTIFYGGKVVVYDSFPATKVKDLLQMVNGGHGAGDKASDNVAPQNLPTHSHKLSDMPIARRNSLHRFLEKRKDRIIAKAPYQVDTPAQASTKKQATGDKSWLGLGQDVTVTTAIKQEI